MKFISGGNCFREKYFETMKQELENGNEIEVGIDCIGYTRNNMEQEAYREALMKEYGDKLIISFHSGVYSYSYSYKLK